MKYLFLITLGVLVVWSGVAMVIQERAEGLFWVTDPNPARRVQVHHFNEYMKERFPEQEIPHLQVDSNNRGLQKIVVQSLGGIGGDIIDIGRMSDLHDLVRAQILEPIDPEWARENGADPSATWPRVYEQITVDGVQYSFPCNVNAPVMWWNLAVLEEVGVELPLPMEMSWDRFLEIAFQIKEWRDARGLREPYILMGVDTTALIWQAGGRILNETGTAAAINSPEALRAIEFYHDLIYKHRIMPTPTERSAMADTGGWGADQAMFAAGRIATFIEGRWPLITFRTQQYVYDGTQPRLDEDGNAVLRPNPLRLGVTFHPVLDLDNKVWRINARSAGINRNSPNKEIAKYFLAYLASDIYSDLINESADAMPPLVRKTETEEYLFNPRYPLETREMNVAFRESLAHGRPDEISRFLPSTEISRIMNNYFQQVANNTLQPADALRFAEQEMNLVIRRRLEYDPRLLPEFQEAVARQQEIDGGRLPATVQPVQEEVPTP